MDDFLHNLRTGKNKPFDRNRKQFDNNGYKNSDRQGANDNRRKEPFQRTPMVDHFPAIKTLLGDISESQRRLAEVYERRAAVEERIALALESISTELSGKKTVFHIKEPDQKDELNSVPVSDFMSTEPVLDSESIRMFHPGEKMDDSLKSVVDRNTVLEIIGEMRKEQMSYEKIAKTLQLQGIPTFSGKGTWHSQTVSKLCHQFHPSLA